MVPYKRSINDISIFNYESDLRNNEHYLSSSENKVWKKQACTEFEPMTSD